MLIIYWKEYYTWRLDKKISHVLITNLKLTLDQSISFQMPRKLIIVYRNNEITSERLNFPVTPFTRYFLLSYLYFSIPRLISSPHIIVVLRSYFSLGSPLLPFFQFSLSPKRATSSFRTSVRALLEERRAINSVRGSFLSCVASTSNRGFHRLCRWPISRAFHPSRTSSFR